MRRTLGDFFSDVGTIITHPADDVDSILHVHVDDVIDAIQGAPIIGGLAPDIRDFVHGPLRDFAKSPLGAIVLTAVTMGAAAAVPFLGPQLEFLAYATPGFVEGGEFGQAWLAGYVDYLKRGVKYLSQNQVDLGLPDLDIPPEVQQEFANYTQQVQDGVKTALDYLHGLAPDVLSKLTYDQLVNQLHIRYDSAVWALANARGNMAEVTAAGLMHFDPTTGQPITLLAWNRGLTPASSTQALQNKSLVAIQMKLLNQKLEHYVTTPHTAMIAGRNIPSAPGPDSATSAAIANGAVKAASPSSSTPYIVGGVVLAGAAAAVAWWYLKKRRR